MLTFPTCSRLYLDRVSLVIGKSALILDFQASEFSIRTQLKTVKKKEFAMDEGEAEARLIIFSIHLFKYR